MEAEMYYGASKFLFDYAKKLRRTQTPAESLLWKQLRNKRFANLKFRRQHPIKNYIVDFYCHAKRLVIELDGSIHDIEEVKNNDISREDDLKAMGLKVIRFTNDDIFKSMHAVLDKVYEECE